MKKTAIDLLWLRPGKVGGTESYIRNLLDGFLHLEDEYEFVLLVSKDNADSFSHYAKDNRFSLLIVNIENANIAKRIIWQNLFQNSFLKKNGIYRCFEPVYCKPWFNCGVEYICVVHDILARHYPRFFPLHELVYSRLCWRMDCINAKQIITISDWVKEDYNRFYKGRALEVIYNPILIDSADMYDWDELRNEYSIDEKDYYYTVSQLIPHKNLKTLVDAVEVIIKENIPIPKKLIISGVNGNSKKELEELISKKGLTEYIHITGYVTNGKRNTLYKHAHTFLFPSIFEGFGMPPVEAMYLGTRVVTTRCTSIPEVTQNKAIYVDNPYDAKEWVEKIRNGNSSLENIDFSLYDPARISQSYYKILVSDNWIRK